MPYLFIVIVLLFEPLFCIAQQQEPRFHRIPEELLQGAELEKFHVTKDGRLWFGTNKGLASFDGSEMVHYANKGLNGMTNFRVGEISEDKAGNLWIASPEYGLVFFNQKTGWFKKINTSINNKIPSSKIEFVSTLVDSGALVWAGSWYRGFFRYDPSSNSSQHYNLQPNKPQEWESRYENTVRYITEDKFNSNILWLACYGSGIFNFNKKTNLLSKKFICHNSTDSVWQDNNITRLEQINDTTIWFSTWSCGMGVYNTKTGVYKMYRRNKNYEANVYPNGYVIEFFSRVSEKEFYVAPRDTIPAVFNTDSKVFNFIDDEELKKEINRTYNVKCNNGLVWLVKGGGLLLSSNKFNLFDTIQTRLANKNHGYPNGEISCINWNEKEKKYYAGIVYGEGVYVYDSTFKLLKKIAMPPSKALKFTTSVWKLHFDKSNRLWALGDIPCVYDTAANRFIPITKKWPHLNISDSAFYDMAENKDGTIYFYSAQKHLFLFDSKKIQLTKIDFPDINNSVKINFYNKRLLIDVQQQYLYVIHDDNLLQYNLSNKKIRVLKIDSTFFKNSSNQFDASHNLDSDGFVWMVTPDYHLWKISCSDFKIIDTVKINNELIDLHGAQINGSHKEYLLISTFKGQCILNTKTGNCSYLRRKNGLMMDNCRWSMICNGKAFVTYPLVGITQYAPLDKLVTNKRERTAYISALTINNQAVETDTLPMYLSALHLNHTKNTVSIEFSSIEFEFPERL